MRRLRRNQLKHAVLVMLAACGLARSSRAQTVSTSFMGNTATGWTFGSSSTNFVPFLTSGTADPSGQGWLRLTDNNLNEATYALYTGGSIAGANRSIYTSFDFALWDSSGIGAADGMTFFMYDASVSTFSVGAFGGSLGYAQKTGMNGLSGGYLGIGLDVYGNYSSPTEGRLDGPGFYPGQVAVRGPGSGTSGYDYITGTANTPNQLSTTTDNLNFASYTSRPLQTGSDYRHASMTLSPAGILNVYLTFGANTQPVLVMTGDVSSYTRPNQIGFGYTAGTGSGSEYAEIRNFTASSLGATLWDNGNGTSNWNEANNWNPNAVPSSGAEILFNNTYVSSNQIVNLQTNTFTVSSLNFDSPFNYTLTNGVVNFATNSTPGIFGIYVSKLNGNGADTVNSAITTTMNLNVDNYGASPLTLNGTIAAGTNSLEFAGSADTVVNGVISGSGSVNQFGTNTLWLDGKNTYSGGTFLSGGGIAIGNSNALGSGALSISSGTIFASGNQTITNSVVLAGNLAVGGANNLTMNGTLLNSGGNNTISLDGTGTTTLGGNITLSDSATQRSLTFDGSGNAVIKGVISDGSSAVNGGSSLIMDGSGNLTLSATNTYSGGTTINNGTITLGASNALNNNGTLTLTGGTLALNGNSQTVGQLSFNNGSVDFGAGNTGDSFGFNGAGTSANNLFLLNYNLADHVGFVSTNAPGTSFLNSIYFAGYGAGASTSAPNQTLTGYGTGWTLLTPNTNNLYTWNGNGANSNWSTSTNWAGGTAPPTGSTSTKLAFDGTNRLSPLMQANYTANVIKFDPTAGAFNLTASAGRSLTLDGIYPSIIDQSTNLEAISIPVVLNQNVIVDVSGSGGLVMSNVVSGTGGIIKESPGVLTLTATNTFTGSNTIDAGAVVLQASRGLGNGNTTTVNSGAELDFQTNSANGNLAVNLALTLNGTGTNSTGALRNISGSNTESGAISLGSDSRINSDSGTLTLSGTVTDNGNNLTIGGSGNTTVSGRVTTGGGDFTKDGTGDVTLSHNGGNNITGNTIVNGGTLDLADASASNSTTGTNVVINSGTLRLQANQQIPVAGDITINSNGVLNLNNFTNTIAVLDSSSTSSVVSLGSGTLQFNSSVTNYQNSIFDGSITGTGRLDKEGPNMLTLGGNSTYSGGTTIGGGVVDLQSGTGLGTGSVSVSNGAALYLEGNLTMGSNPISISGAGPGSLGALRNLSGNDTVGGTVTMTSSSRINSDSGTLTLNGNVGGSGNTLTVGGAGNTTINGNIQTGTGGLIMDGTGMLTLAGTNTYTGNTTVSGGGTLALSTAGGGAIAAGTLTLTNSSTLLLGASNQLNKNVNIVAGGGAGSGANIVLANNTSNTAGSLTLTGNSSISFPSTAGQTGTINFQTSNDSIWNGVLYVDDWTTNGVGDTLKFGSSNLGLGSGGPVFTNIIFVNPNGLSGNFYGMILPDGRVTPVVPEVGGFAYGGILAGLIGMRHRRRLKDWLDIISSK